ncbi:hypothetical protein LCM20_16240 [Halobacillus litoralis]|uniref:hypothetical protein n=1 Tax=Halobacillus litoralis TaxID=45668 RepID=UPI001CD4320B|nr:hypothetical protein [Halobacillus litoralis]MCA0972158.1 hypothetical protein [Halobacillus litoralis]
MRMTKMTIPVAILSLAVLIYSVYVHVQHTNLVNRMESSNENRVMMVGVHGDDIATPLEQFIEISERENPDLETLAKYWSKVNFYQTNMNATLSSITTFEDSTQSTNRSKMVHILHNVNRTIDYMSEDFLFNEDFTMTQKDQQQLKAILKIYQNVAFYIDEDLPDFEGLFGAIRGPLRTIDPQTADLLYPRGS